MDFLDLENLYDSLLPDLEQVDEIPPGEPTPWEKVMATEGETEQEKFDRAFLAYVAKVDQLGNQIAQLRTTEEYYTLKAKEAKEARGKLEEEQGVIQSTLAEQLLKQPKGKYQATNGHTYGTRKSSSVNIVNNELVPVSAKTMDVSIKLNMFEYYRFISAMAGEAGVEIDDSDVAKGAARFMDYLAGLAEFDDLGGLDFMSIKAKMTPSKTALKKYQQMQDDNPEASELGFEIVQSYALTKK